MNNKNNKKQSRAGEIATITGIAAASVAAYLFLGPNGKEHRKTAGAWGNKMKKEVVDKMKKVKNLSEPVYHEIVDTVSSKYDSLGNNIDKRELALVLADLKRSWNRIVKMKNARMKTKKSKPSAKAKTKS